MHRTYKYTYDGKPLTHCPGCSNNLTEPDGVEIELSINGVNLSARSNLSPDGVLRDTADDAVAKGFHSSTNCHQCGEQLINFDGVEEEDIG
jgi:ribosomal protein S27E